MIHARLPPGPRGPLIGGLINPGRDPLAFLTRLARTYGDVAYFRLGSERAFFINHPQHIRDVLVTHDRNFTKSRGLERAKKLLGEGLLTSEGAAHMRQRRLLQPAFHRDRIDAYASVMVEHADRMRRRWTAGAEMDVSREMMRLTLSIVGKTLFDSDVESKADEIGTAVTRVLETFWLTLLPFPDFIEKLPLPMIRRSRAGRAKLDHLIYALIAERRAAGHDRGDLLSMLLMAQDEEDGSGLSDRQVRDEAMTLILAGHETTANALAWMWYLVSQSLGVETRLHEEIDRVLQGRLPGAADLGALPFVEQVVTESMRLYPPAWVVGRRALADYAIGDFVVPARSVVFMSPYVMQRDSRYYADADRFLPERWTPDFKAALPKFAYFPFGGGPRQCIGEPFARMELALLVATIAQRWRLRLVPDQSVVPRPLITLRPKHGINMTAVAR
ncbi:MAG: cytochrome P450 [Acidobacteria bacterium]|nr:MAG: cytochrome P450 [Acidobacteriota bacterium]